MYKVTDFEVGQKVALEVTGNEARRPTYKDVPIREGIVEKVGKKYVTVCGMQFLEHPAYIGLREKTDSCVNFVLYPNRQVLEEKLERDETLSSIQEFFRLPNNSINLSLEQLKDIQKIIGGNAK